ncbi:hypothetical protein B5S32_g1328 [[Candida] boidinii]|nr:hypothetical protein B5S32_g1328 [[Candida] boidinii]
MSPSINYSTNPQLVELVDTVVVKNLKYRAKLLNRKTITANIKNSTNSPDAVPLTISLNMKTSFWKASLSDDLKYSINYAVMCRNILDYADKNSSKIYKSLENLGENLLADVIINEKSPCTFSELKIQQKSPNENKKYDSIELTLNRYSETNPQGNQFSVKQLESVPDIVRINGLTLDTIIGIFKEERLAKQPIILDLELKIDNQKNSTTGNSLNYYDLIEKVHSYLELSNFKTVEALVLNTSNLIFLQSENIIGCKVAVLKSEILEFTDGVGVTIDRERKNVTEAELVSFEKNELFTTSTDEINFSLTNLNSETILNESKDHEYTVYIAFGSNQGNQLENIETAIQSLNEREIKVKTTSTLYMSKPMYYLDQPDFVNGVLKATTKLSPKDLLKALKEIEYDVLKRVKKFDNGPRSIDLDIILYDNLIVSEPDLNIPHISMLERSFVLCPLCELVPPDYLHPVTAEPIHSHLDQLLKTSVDSSIQESIDLLSLVPLPRKQIQSINKDNTSQTHGFRRLEFDMFTGDKTGTKLMGILNVTPDSFSDGGLNTSLNKALQTVKEMYDEGVDIIDIGGCSTRPGSEQPLPDEELNRVLPVIKAIRELEAPYCDVLLSIDTYRASIAEQAIIAGIDIINDISSGTFDEEMFDVVARYGVPYVMSHTRGDIQTMSKLVDYSRDEKNMNTIEYINRNEYEYLSDDEIVISCEIAKELSQRIQSAISRGVKRWQIITDPGIGFAKNLKQNLVTIRATRLIKNYSILLKDETTETTEFISLKRLPILLGPSRKKFIGTLTDKTVAKDRTIGTCATVMSCIGYGADIVRAHDYREVREVCQMGDAIYKRRVNNKSLV